MIKGLDMIFLITFKYSGIKFTEYYYAEYSVNFFNMEIYSPHFQMLFFYYIFDNFLLNILSMLFFWNFYYLNTVVLELVL